MIPFVTSDLEVSGITFIISKYIKETGLRVKVFDLSNHNKTQKVASCSIDSAYNATSARLQGLIYVLLISNNPLLPL